MTLTENENQRLHFTQFLFTKTWIFLQNSFKKNKTKEYKIAFNSKLENPVNF